MAITEPDAYEGAKMTSGARYCIIGWVVGLGIPSHPPPCQEPSYQEAEPAGGFWKVLCSTRDREAQLAIAAISARAFVSIRRIGPNGTKLPK